MTSLPFWGVPISFIPSIIEVTLFQSFYCLGLFPGILLLPDVLPPPAPLGCLLGSPGLEDLLLFPLSRSQANSLILFLRFVPPFLTSRPLLLPPCSNISSTTTAVPLFSTSTLHLLPPPPPQRVWLCFSSSHLPPTPCLGLACPAELTAGLPVQSPCTPHRYQYLAPFPSKQHPSAGES